MQTLQIFSDFFFCVAFSRKISTEYDMQKQIYAKKNGTSTGSQPLTHHFNARHSPSIFFVHRTGSGIMIA